MKIKLISKPNHDIPPRVQICLNRGIDPKAVPTYLKGGILNVNPPEAFDENLLKAGARILINHIQKGDNVFIVVDSDCDGMTSAAHLINYLYELAPGWTVNHVKWGLHTGKQHGLPDMIDYIKGIDVSLVICPDSATNDVDQIAQLHGLGIDVLILDHHLSDVPMSSYAVTINSQYNYPNPQLSGVGVVHKFCQYIDELLNKNYSDKFLDLTAIGLMGDMMSMTSFETKEMIFEGLKEENLVNPLIAGLAKKNEFALKKADYLPSRYNNLSITPIGAAFFIIPLLNAICRSGEMEEKELIFDAMLTMKAFDIVPSTKRGHKQGETERILDQALRTCTNVKNRQTRNEDAGMELLTAKAEKMLNNKVLVFALEPGEIDPNIAGLVANKLQSKYQRPACIVTKISDKENTYAGSMRGYTATGIDNFKAIAETSSSCNWVRGHENAAGISITNPDNFIADMNEALKDISTDILYRVDYMWDESYIDGEAVLEIASMNDYIGTDFFRPMVYVHDIPASTMQIMKSNTLRFDTSSNVSLITFGATDEDIEKLSQPGIKINAVCKCAENEWNGNISPQLIIEDYEIVQPTSTIDSWGF